MSDILDTRFEGKTVELKDNRVSPGDDINLMAKDPALRRIKIGAGWDLNVYDADAPDADLSVFLIGREGVTRVDEDFVFYNNTQACDGAIKHGGDSRTGAGDGDDEIIAVDLQGVPFDIMRMIFSLTLYKGDEKRQELGMIRNAYVRIINADNNMEILRYELDPVFRDNPSAGAIVAEIGREGSKWHFRPMAEFHERGLGPIAQKFGIIVTQQ